MAKEVNKQHHIERKRSNNGNDNYKLLKNGLAHGRKINLKSKSLGNSKFYHHSNGNNNLPTARNESTAIIFNPNSRVNEYLSRYSLLLSV